MDNVSVTFSLPQQELHDVIVAILGSSLEGIHSVVPPAVDIGSSFDEIVDDVEIILDDRFHEDSVERGIGGVDVSAGLDQ